MVECTALEMRRRCKPTVGSNPTLSAIHPHKHLNLQIFSPQTATQPLHSPQRFGRICVDMKLYGIVAAFGGGNLGYGVVHAAQLRDLGCQAHNGVGRHLRSSKAQVNRSDPKVSVRQIAGDETGSALLALRDQFEQ